MSDSSQGNAPSASPDAVEVPEIVPEAMVFPPFETMHYPSQLLWLALSFGLFYLLMSRLFLPRIAGVLEDRRDRIANDRDEAARLAGLSGETRMRYEDELARARAGAQTMIGEKNEAARKAAAEKRVRAEAEMARRIAESETRIARARDAGLAQIVDIAEAVVPDIVMQMTGKKPVAQAMQKAVAGIRAGKLRP